MLRLGIDLGGTKTEGVVLDLEGHELYRERRPTPQADGYDAIIANIRDLVADLEQRAGAEALIGIGMPGSLSGATGLVRNANTTSLNGREFLQDVTTALQRQVRVSNDANCFALAEAQAGAGRGHACVFGVIVGTGVGAGVVIDGRVLNGRLGIGGEWGHNQLVIRDDEQTIAEPPLCYCGRLGCVETWLSGPALAKAYARNGGGDATARDVVTRARAQDAVASKTLRQYMKRFGHALAGVINVLDPDIVVLGGGLSKISELYTEGRAAVEPHVFSDYFDTPIVAAEGGDSAGVIGAAWLWSNEEASA